MKYKLTTKNKQGSQKLNRVGKKIIENTMKRAFLIVTTLALLSLGVNAQTKKDGTPDMRYKENKETYGNGFSTPSYSPSKTYSPTYYEPKKERNYSNGGQYKLQDGYQKSNGTYVAPHIKTTPDNIIYNNYKPRN